jgi:hypothetical protein
MEFFQSIHWDSFWLGVVVTVVVGVGGAFLFNVVGESL